MQGVGLVVENKVDKQVGGSICRQGRMKFEELMETSLYFTNVNIVFWASNYTFEIEHNPGFERTM